MKENKISSISHFTFFASLLSKHAGEKEESFVFFSHPCKRPQSFLLRKPNGVSVRVGQQLLKKHQKEEPIYSTKNKTIMTEETWFRNTKCDEQTSKNNSKQTHYY